MIDIPRSFAITWEFLQFQFTPAQSAIANFLSPSISELQISLSTEWNVLRIARTSISHRINTIGGELSESSRLIFSLQQSTFIRKFSVIRRTRREASLFLSRLCYSDEKGSVFWPIYVHAHRRFRAERCEISGKNFETRLRPTYREFFDVNLELFYETRNRVSLVEMFEFQNSSLGRVHSNFGILAVTKSLLEFWKFDSL